MLYGENKKADGLVVKVGEGANFKLNPKRRKADAPRPAKVATKAKAPAKPRAKGLAKVLELAPEGEAV